MTELNFAAEVVVFDRIGATQGMVDDMVRRTKRRDYAERIDVHIDRSKTHTNSQPAKMWSQSMFAISSKTS